MFSQCRMISVFRAHRIAGSRSHVSIVTPLSHSRCTHIEKKWIPIVGLTYRSTRYSFMPIVDLWRAWINMKPWQMKVAKPFTNAFSMPLQSVGICAIRFVGKAWREKPCRSETTACLVWNVTSIPWISLPFIGWVENLGSTMESVLSMGEMLDGDQRKNALLKKA